MENIVNQIGYAMSLRTPQKEALQYLDAISSNCDYKRNTLAEVEAIATANCEDKHTIKIDDNFKFPSFCFDMATGIGKTRLMGAAIYYLYKTKGYKHFFILAPGNTIYDKLRKESNPAHPKYIFKGLEAEMGRPKVYDGENYTKYPVRYVQGEIEIEKTSEIQIFIFNIGKIFNSKTDTTFKFHKYQETLGSSFADVLAKFDDLVICMDEAHRYYAPASMKAISYLKPILGLEFTATPKSHKNVIYSYDLAKGAGKFLKIPVVMGRTNTGGYSAEDIEEMKIRDGLTLHENRKKVVYQYCLDNNLAYVKPIVLIACKDTEHAKKIRALIDSDEFNNGRYRGKVIEIHSNMKGEETEDNIRKLLSNESAHNPVEIVLHVYKLKEGWDVNNLFTIIPLNAAKSDILALQTIGRGLRLPFGAITGNEAIDTLDIVAHDHYREIVEDIKNSDTFRYRDLDDKGVEPTKMVEISSGIGDGQLSLLDDIFVSVGVKTFDAISDVKTQDKMYEEYMKSFGKTAKPEKKESNQYSFFDLMAEQEAKEKGEESTETVIAVVENTPTGMKKVQPMKKEDFVAAITELSKKAISVPKILVQPSSTVTLKPFTVKRTIPDFEIAASKIERYNAVNAEMLESFDAEILAVDDALNTLACMLLDCDALSEISVDEDADYILDVVQQYLAQIEGSDEDKNKIVRRYAKLIIEDIVKQIHANMDRKTFYTHVIQKDLIVFRKAVKNVRADGGEVNFRKTIANKSEIKKYVFNGYKKSYYNTNAFDSDTERLFSVVLEDDADVIRWIKPPLNQLGLFWQAGQQYNPDFLVETSTTKYMVEVKAKNEVKNPDVIGKAKEGIKWCKYATMVDFDKKPWEYKLITDDVIAVGNSLKYILGLSENIETEE
ncbi:MAG: DEAD/DEAH box helicase family protein [Clostridia bacterium]|nr:DEAD/DEAH box helicase family protein [Clostridia bacterium]